VYYVQAASRVGQPERNVIMMRKLFAVGCLAGLIVIGAMALAYAGPCPSGSEVFISNLTTTRTFPADRLGGVERVDCDQLGGVGHAHGVECASLNGLRGLAR
jgi:hypothetical protein